MFEDDSFGIQNPSFSAGVGGIQRSISAPPVAEHVSEASLPGSVYSALLSQGTEDVDRNYFGNQPSRLNPRMPKPSREGFGVGFGPGQFFEPSTDIALGPLDDVNNSRLSALIVDTKPKTPMALIQEDFPSTPSSVYSNRGLLSTSKLANPQDQNVNSNSSSTSQQSPQSPNGSTKQQLSSIHHDSDDSGLAPLANNGGLMIAREFVPHSAHNVDAMMNQATLGMGHMHVSDGGAGGGYSHNGMMMHQQHQQTMRHPQQQGMMSGQPQMRGVSGQNQQQMYVGSQQQYHPHDMGQQHLTMQQGSGSFGFHGGQQGVYQQQMHGQYLTQQETVLGNAPSQYYMQPPPLGMGAQGAMYPSQQQQYYGGNSSLQPQQQQFSQPMVRGVPPSYGDQNGSYMYAPDHQQQLQMSAGGNGYWDPSVVSQSQGGVMGGLSDDRQMGQQPQQMRGVVYQQQQMMNPQVQYMGGRIQGGQPGGGMLLSGQQTQQQQALWPQNVVQGGGPSIQQIPHQQIASQGNGSQMLYSQTLSQGMGPTDGLSGSMQNVGSPQRLVNNGVHRGALMDPAGGQKDLRRNPNGALPSNMAGRGGGNVASIPRSTSRSSLSSVNTSISATSTAGGMRDPLVEEFRNTFGKSKQWEIKDLIGHIVAFCQDQHGSRFIQQRLEVAPDAEKQLVFDELVPCAQSLMTDVFGNYVIQKLFEFGNPDQCEMLACMLMGQAVVLALQMYGCRVIQKALEYVNTERLIALVGEFEGQQVLRCVHDQNGNHVIQKCIEVVCRVSRDADPAMSDYLSSKIQFIISAFQGRVRELSMHPYGCRVVQRILEHCSNVQKASVLEELRRCCNELVQDQYGNYVIQHVMQHGWDADKALLIREVQSRLLEYATHKFASNVVEKCLQYANRRDRDEMIWTIINVTFDMNSPVDVNTGQCCLESMVRDPYANYVVQKVIDVSDEKQRGAIVRYVKENIVQLRRYTYGKHIIVRLEKVCNEKF